MKDTGPRAVQLHGGAGVQNDPVRHTAVPLGGPVLAVARNGGTGSEN